MNILGISAFYHDSAAALVTDGKIVAAAQEERFTRKKHDPAFPAKAIDYCLAEAGIGPGDLDYVAFYEKPYLKFERLLETYLAFAPAGLRSFRQAKAESADNRFQRIEFPSSFRGGFAKTIHRGADLVLQLLIIDCGNNTLLHYHTTADHDGIYRFAIFAENKLVKHIVQRQIVNMIQIYKNDIRLVSRRELTT